MTPGYPLMMMPGGHVTAGFKKIIDVGYGAIRKQARDWLDAHENDLMGENAEKVMFYTAVTIACDAAIILARRYGEACGKRPDGSGSRPEGRAAVYGGLSGLDRGNPLPHLPGGPAAGPAVPVSSAFSVIGDSGSFGRWTSIPGPI
jgi:formate C-acetyltransferase